MRQRSLTTFHALGILIGRLGGREETEKGNVGIEMVIEKTETPCDLKKCADTWLSASIAAHTFVEPDFWARRHSAVFEEYLPASEVYIAVRQSNITGFAAVCNGSLSALFVDPAEWGKGVGSNLVCRVQELYENLHLAVYKSNARAVHFYQKHGFSLQGEQLCPHTGEPELLMVRRKG